MGKIWFIGTILIFLFYLPVYSAISWDVSEIIYLSSMEDSHIGTGISEIIFLSSMEEELHIGEGISDIIFLSSYEETDHTGESVSELCLLSSTRYGDVDNNSIVESLDSSLILQYLVGIDPSPSAPLPWEEWRLTISNVNGNEFIEAYDASLILMYVAGFIDIFPVEELLIPNILTDNKTKLEIITSKLNKIDNTVKYKQYSKEMK